MNLHAIASSAIQVVNPMIDVSVRVSTGYTIDDAGLQVPTYDVLTGVTAQVQALTYDDIKFLDGLQIQGNRRKIYLYGRYLALNRETEAGGDLIDYPDGNEWPYGTVWKIVQVVEQWPDWSCVYVTQQLDGS